MLTHPPKTSIHDLLERYDLFLIDAYGVLMTTAGPLPGAREFLAAIDEAPQKDYFILTNDASRTPETCVRVYAERGLPVPLDKVLSAGVAIIETFKSEKLEGSRTCVLGTADTHECVRRAGGVIGAITAETDYDVLVIGDDSGFNFLPTMNDLLTCTHRLIAKGRKPRFLLANPDLLYPRSNDSFGFTSGSLAKFLEIGLKDLHPDLDLDFEVLGKPSSLLYDLALARTNTPRAKTVMLGDQLHTDIAGAERAGLDSALLATGVTQLPLKETATHRPTYILESLS